MIAPVSGEQSYGDAFNVAFPNGSRGFSPLRSRIRVSRIGKKVRVVQSAAADDSYFYSLADSFLVLMEPFILS